MSLIAPWQQRYLIGAQTSSISTAVTFDGSAVSIDTGKSLWKVTNMPFINPSQQIIDQRKATGQATRLTGTGGEFQLGIQRPVVTIEFDVNANILTLLLWSLFQGGVSEAAGTPFVKTAVPYTSPSASVWLSLAYVLSTSTAGENAIASGGICRSITISGDEQGQSIKGSAEIAFASYAATYDASSATITDPAIAPLLYKNMDFTFAGDAINIPSFSITISNNATGPSYHATTIQKWVLGDLTIEGEIVVPKNSGNSNHDNNAMITDLVNLTDNILTLYWGNTPASASGNVSLILNGLTTDVDKVEEMEVGTRVPFMNVDDTSNDISWTWADTIDRSI